MGLVLLPLLGIFLMLYLVDLQDRRRFQRLKDQSEHDRILATPVEQLAEEIERGRLP